MERTLKIDTHDGKWGHVCDGCGEFIPGGVPFLTGIEPCCHCGPWRQLCADCVRYAYNLIAEATSQSPP